MSANRPGTGSLKALKVAVLLLLLSLLWLHSSPIACAQVVVPDTSFVPTPAPALDTAARDSTQQKRFLDFLRRMSQRKTIFGRAIRALVVFKPRKLEGSVDAELLPQDQEKHNYKVVRNIHFVRMDAFGYNINDTLQVPDNALEKFGNALHSRSKPRLLRNKLLFQKGKFLEPLALSESERLLRQTDYIVDARILVNDSSSTQDSVDITVITKDIFSLSGSGSVSTSGTRLALRDINFLGLGHQVRTVGRFATDDPQGWLFQGSYLIENIYRSYISAELIYRNEYTYKQQGISFQRDFYSTNTKYAGGATINWYQTLQPDFYEPEVYDTDPVPTPAPILYKPLDYNVQDIWVGRAFRLKSYDLSHDNPGRLITALRVMNVQYTQGTGPTIQSARLYLSGLGYSFRRYYKDQYLFGFGRTEDIPAGNLLAVTAGFEDGSAKNRLYFGAKAAFGKYRPSFGYLYGGLEYGSYRYQGGWEQGVLTSEALYFTPLYKLNRWRWRHFLWNRTQIGLRRPDLFALHINQEDGIRGFRSEAVRGYRKFVLNYETNFFAPVTVFGFRLAVVGFADLAWITEKKDGSPFSEKPYTGVGMGFRFRNEYLPFSTIQILVGYYPRVPIDNQTDLKFFRSSRPYYDFNDLRFTQPLITEFR
ncbi:hypothetical protein [Rufibacter sp. DG15C]|uniref:hypothetical protein n=1 Tax=Rufibacter sp. DG15C TaxID=1379909 RepID=UPI00082C175B|nr:hypothetical protein [Rufibacter sp. DG15C]